MQVTCRSIGVEAEYSKGKKTSKQEVVKEVEGQEVRCIIHVDLKNTKNDDRTRDGKKDPKPSSSFLPNEFACKD